MSGDADLSGENHAFSDHRTSGQTGLRANQCVFFDRAGMSDLHEIVNFRAAFDSRFADRSTINRRIRADLDIIFQHNSPDLRNFQPSFFFRLCITETVRTDCRVIVNDAVFADLAIFADRNAGMNHGIFADLHAVVNRYVRKNLYICDNAVFSDWNKGINRDGFGNLGGFINKCRLDE